MIAAARAQHEPSGRRSQPGHGVVRLASLELREVRIPFRFSFKHALAERKEANNLFVAVRTDSAHTGYGEVLPRPYLTGETVASAWQDICERWWPAVRALDFPANRPPTETLRSVYVQADAARKTGSYAGVDIAIHDAWGRATGTPGHMLFGQVARPQRLTCALGGGGVRSVRWVSRMGKLVGFREFKLKTGRADDVERLRAARRILGPACDLRVDANAGWTVDEALALADTLRQHGVTSIEQPIPPGDVEGLARIQQESGIDVMADESLCSRADVGALLAARAANMWNVRLAKVGGFTGVRELIHLALPAGVKIHLGVLVGESAVLTAAGRACAGLADFAHVEFGFPRILLKHQPFAGDPGGYRGTGHPLRSSAGLGVAPNPSVLDRFTVRKLDLT